MKLNSILFGILVFFMISCKNESIGQTGPNDIKKQIEKDPGIMVDVRTLDEWNSGHHPRAIHADWEKGDFVKQSKSWDTSKTYYLYCAAGGRSSQATEHLKKNGYKKVINLGGYDAVKNLK
ncbi:MAG: rhodanese-like domain-containing protein [Saprospiraceae bacterium]|nr:rhodanese-like domain-containing protein [Saprospiraceae bacterium]